MDREKRLENQVLALKAAVLDSLRNQHEMVKYMQTSEGTKDYLKERIAKTANAVKQITPSRGGH